MEMDTKVTVHDAMTSSVITADPKTTVADAAVLMSRFKIGCLIINDETGPLGLITESDIIEKVVAKNIIICIFLLLSQTGYLNSFSKISI